MLRIVTFNVNSDQISDQSLESCQIHVAKRVSRLCEIVADSSASLDVEVALVAFDCIPQEEQKPLIAVLNGQGVCVIALQDDRLPMGQLLDAGADAVVSKSADSSQIACAVWSAHRRFLSHRELQQQLARATKQSERRLRTDRGKAGLAVMLDISEADALGRIRRIARNARRPMSEICETLIEAQQIIESAKKLKPPAPAFKNARPARVSPLHPLN